ncbi:hypothetical protein AMTR_s00024p00013500 [Amborella trichopoda]|uniref:Oberon-like PHD finger domain-containing protein n=1 Tax=Amborella trichopoda TaxID=13333 RepID=W1PLU8_AMBTC|nr:hypothetical protein AMTR_s00024p00013500 [Amborella trichopoda]
MPSETERREAKEEEGDGDSQRDHKSGRHQPESNISSSLQVSPNLSLRSSLMGRDISDKPTENLLSLNVLDDPSRKNRVFHEGDGFFLGEKRPDFGELKENVRISHELKPKDNGSLQKVGNHGAQELTLSYMCDSIKVGLPDKGISGKLYQNSMEDMHFGLGKGKYKGKEVVIEEKGSDDCADKWVERDFLQLRSDREREDSSPCKNGEPFKKGLKRESEKEGLELSNGEKKAKMETLNLSLSLPDVSLTLAAASTNLQSNSTPNIVKRAASNQSLTLSNNHTRTSSDDFTASLSYSYSHPFSHNPSCSLTRNSAENYEYSVGSYHLSRRENEVSNGRTDQMWYGGEGTNGSVHSRFRAVPDVPIYQRSIPNGNLNPEKVSSSQIIASGAQSELDPVGPKRSDPIINYSRHSYPAMPEKGVKDSTIDLYKSNSFEKKTFFPLELPAKQRRETQSSDNSLVRSEDKKRGYVNVNRHCSDGGQPSRVYTKPERILHDIVTDSIPTMAHASHVLPEDLLEATRLYLKNLMASPERREELASLQRRLERRSDLTSETLSRSHKTQLDILVTLKTGISDYLFWKNPFPTSKLVEIFLLSRCKNPTCSSVLPVEDCDCKICANKGFCSACMCQICLKFDCASNTCSWVGCDVCSHWCHADCGIQMQYIKPGPSLKESSGTTEMQFYCLGCGHTSEMFGFVKEVFLCFARRWSFEILVKELDYVRRIFRYSEDRKGKELHNRAEELLMKMNKKLLSPSDACNTILQFLKG